MLCQFFTQLLQSNGFISFIKKLVLVNKKEGGRGGAVLTSYEMRQMELCGTVGEHEGGVV